MIGDKMQTGNMYDHTLDVVKGAPNQHRLDYSGINKEGEVFYEGSLISVDSTTNELITGCGNGSGGNRPMPMFAIRSSEDLDVVVDGANISGGTASAVVVTGGFEVKTSEINPNDVYKVNDMLTPSSGLNKGKIEKAHISPYGGRLVCGFVSAPVVYSEYGVPVLSLWTAYIPAGEATTREDVSEESSSSGSSASSASSDSSASSEGFSESSASSDSSESSSTPA